MTVTRKQVAEVMLKSVHHDIDDMDDSISRDDIKMAQVKAALESGISETELLMPLLCQVAESNITRVVKSRSVTSYANEVLQTDAFNTMGNALIDDSGEIHLAGNARLDVWDRQFNKVEDNKVKVVAAAANMDDLKNILHASDMLTNPSLTFWDVFGKPEDK